jgi:hypothetical protein
VAVVEVAVVDMVLLSPIMVRPENGEVWGLGLGLGSRA